MTRATVLASRHRVMDFIVEQSTTLICSSNSMTYLLEFLIYVKSAGVDSLFLLEDPPIFTAAHVCKRSVITVNQNL